MKIIELVEHVNDLDITKDYFAWGTLRDPDVLRLVTGREHDFSIVARLTGFKAVHAKGKNYPASIPKRKSHIEGRLIKDLTDEDWKKIDWYEDQLYDTKPMFVELKDGKRVKAQVYAFHDPKRVTPLLDKDWTYKEWKKTEKKDWLKKIPGFMKGYKG